MSIVLENVTYTYMEKTPFERTAIKDVCLAIEEGEFVAIIGHTGSGKSTLVQHLNGILKPSKGKVMVGGVDIGKKSADAVAAKRTVGLVFQYPEHQLFAETVYEDIAFGPRNGGLAEEDVERRVKKAMAFVGLDFAQYRDRSPLQLSGGQMRRVAIAGVVALEPKFLILDEPSAGLDPRSRDAIFLEIEKLRKVGIAVILVSHNMDDAAKFANRIIVMNKGEIALDAPPSKAFCQEELLRAAGLDIPQITKLLRHLKRKGIPVNTTALTLKDAVTAIHTAMKREKK